MNTADYAFITGIVSLLISIGAFVWNVWSKFIHPKPDVAVGFSRMNIYHPGGPLDGDKFLMVTATNRGPGTVIVQHVVVCKRWKWQREVVGILNPIDDLAQKPYTSRLGPASGGLPKKLDVGESHDFNFPSDSKFLTAENLEESPFIGVSDSFGRFHLTAITPPRDPLAPVGTPFARALRAVDKRRARTMRWLRKHLALRKKMS